MTGTGPLRLAEPARFYDTLRASRVLGPKISEAEFKGCEVILLHAGAARVGIRSTANLLATAFHETAGTMEPIDEYGGNAYFTKLYDVQGTNPARAKRMGNTLPGDGARYHGRGFVQLTWKDNYKKAGENIGIDLVAYPERAKELDVAAQVLVLGCLGGWFTGKKLEESDTFEEMRKVVNGTDKAELIAGHSNVFLRALQAGEWS